MFFRRLPPDTYPDDFDSDLYTRYSPRLKPGLGARFRSSIPRLLVGLTLFGAILMGFMFALIVLPPVSPQIVVITSEPSATPVGDLQGDFPAGVIQQSITLPARIDEALSFGEKDGYRFVMYPGITWVITVYPDSQLDPQLTLYNPDGTIAEINDDISATDLTSQIVFTAPTSGQYGIIVESSGAATAGGYTLSILPQ